MNRMRLYFYRVLSIFQGNPFLAIGILFILLILISVELIPPSSQIEDPFWKFTVSAYGLGSLFLI